MNAAFPLKKRRGRPPKYLNVWKQQFLTNAVASVAIVTDCMAEHGSKHTAGHLIKSGITTILDSPGVSERAADESTSNNICDLQLSPVSSDSDVGDPRTPSGPSSDRVIAQEASQRRIPVKRRPGRPPGSTKRSKILCNPHHKDRAAGDEDFSLRRFFEAGGRDYNEYLEWLKRRKGQVKSPTQLQPTVPPAMFPPQIYPMPIMRGQMLLPATHPGVLSAGFPFPAQFPISPGVGPQSPVVAVTPPVVCRADGQLLRSPSFPDKPNPDSHRKGEQDTSINTAESQTEHGHTDEYTTNALDLSITRKLSHSDSEKENDVLPEEINHKKFRYNKETVASSHRNRKVDDGSPNDKFICVKTDKSVQSIQERTPYNHSPGEATTQEAMKNTGSQHTQVVSWDVEQVANFVAGLPECHVYSQTFRDHRIDGSLLPHLSDYHLLKHLGMKLGHMIRLKLALEDILKPD